MARVDELELDKVNRAFDEMNTDLLGRIKRLEKGTTLPGATGTFTAGGVTVTVTNGLITKIG